MEQAAFCNLIGQLRMLTPPQLGEVQQEISTLKARAIKVGCKVSFVNGSGETITGVVARINPKTVLIAPDVGKIRWKVSPNLLQIL